MASINGFSRMTILILTIGATLIWFPSLPDFTQRFTIPKDLALSVVAVIGFFSLYARQARGSRVSLPLSVPVAVYIAISLMSFKNALSWHFLLRQITFDLMGFSFFWVTTNLISKDKIKAALWVVVGLISLSSAISYAGLDVQGHPSWTSTFGNPEYGAGLWVMAAAVTLGLGGVAWPVGGMLLAHLVMAEARSAILGLMLGVGLLIWRWASRRQILGAAALGILIVLALIVSPWTKGTSWGQMFVLGEDREHIYRASAYYVMEHPMFGLGRGNFQVHSYGFVYKWGGANLENKGYFRELHNDYLQLLIEAGPVALGVWLFILWRILWPMPVKGDLIGAGLFVGLLAELFRAFFLFPFQLGPDMAVFWMMAGLYWVRKQ